MRNFWWKFWNRNVIPKWHRFTKVWLTKTAYRFWTYYNDFNLKKLSAWPRNPLTGDKDLSTMSNVRPGRLPGACHSLPEGIRCDYRPFSLGSIASHTRAFMRFRREVLMVLNFTTSRTAGVIVVHLSGAILFGEESASLLILVRNLLNNSHQIVLDLGNVTHFDSGSVGTLVAVCASARKVGGDIKFANLGNHTKEVLQITKFLTVFEIFGKTEDAIASFKESTATR